MQEYVQLDRTHKVISEVLVIVNSIVFNGLFTNPFADLI